MLARLFNRRKQQEFIVPNGIVRQASESDQHLAELVQQWGVVQVKEAVPLKEIIQFSADAVDYYLWHRLPAGPGSILAVGPDAAMDTTVEVNTSLVRALCFGKAGQIARAHFNKLTGSPDFIIPIIGLQVRVMPAKRNVDVMVPYHQDAVVLPPGARMLNAWTLLYPTQTGNEAAGLELIPSDNKEIFRKEKNPSHPTKGWIEADYEKLNDLLARFKPWIPHIELGDIVLFDESCAHRTYHEASTKPRIALEFRMIALDKKITDALDASNNLYFTVEGSKITGPSYARIGFGKGVTIFKDRPLDAA